MCKYNNPYYWEGILLKKKNLWKNNFATITSPQDAIFVNTVVIDYGRDIIDNNWACYPEAKSLLGFIQYVYLPLAFFYIINEKNQDLYIPICSRSEMIECIKESGSHYGNMMEEALEEISTYWELDNQACLGKIKEFSLKFNAVWSQEQFILNLGIFASTVEIAESIIKNCAMSGVLEEYTGVSTTQLMKLCENFYTDPFSKNAFVKILNDDIGCMISQQSVS